MLAISLESSGLAWGFRADFLRSISLYQHCIVGSGDRAAIFAFLSSANGISATMRKYGDFPFFRSQPLALVEHWKRWASECAALLDADVGFVDQGVKSYTHGSFSYRNYARRHQLLHDFDPESDIAADNGEPWHWSSHKPQLHDRVAAYFYERREDD